MTELVTGLGMLGLPSLEAALAARPAQMVSVAPETWELLERAHRGGALAAEFAGAWQNGAAFLHAREGLRDRRPVTVEWKGSHRAPGDEVAPIDLRVDHVYLVSCKYLSRITINASPFHLFERLLAGGHGQRGGDWYEHVAAAELEDLYSTVRGQLGLAHLPSSVTTLDRAERSVLADAIGREWPEGSQRSQQRFVEAVSTRTARIWRERSGSRAEAEALLWRMLRIGSAPYFVLGSASTSEPLRLRIDTPWDWRLAYRLRSFSVEAQPGGQPRVGWQALVEDVHSGQLREVAGHVEIRWSHGRFGGNPEAKVYLDTPHRAVPGYHDLA